MKMPFAAPDDDVQQPVSNRRSHSRTNTPQQLSSTDSEPPSPRTSPRKQAYLLLLDLALQGRDLDLHLLDLVLGQDLDAVAGVGVVQGLEGQVRQRDVPLALVLLMASVHESRMEGSRRAAINIHS